MAPFPDPEKLRTEARAARHDAHRVAMGLRARDGAVPGQLTGTEGMVVNVMFWSEH
jgi:hypothetical protein